MESSRRIRVLVAEDDFLVGEEISRALKAIGYEQIGIASNGEAALEKTCSLRPDVVLMDI
jgi:DNA-binding NarL/FixJ family response regulator